MKIKISDVAKAAGVSAATVSKVFNPQGSDNIKISDKTKQHVLAVAEKLNYMPNYGAKLLRSGKSYTIGFATENDRSFDCFVSEYTREIINGVGAAAYKDNYNVLLINGKDYLEYCENSRMDGLVIVGYYRDRDSQEKERLAGYKAMSDKNFPFVLINGIYEDKDYSAVSVDNESGMKQILEMIVRRGYRKIGFLGELGDNLQRHHIQREKFLREGLAQLGLPVNESYFIHGPSTERKAVPPSGNYSHIYGFLGMKEVHEKGMDIDCLVCGGDEIAMGALKYANEHKISVPGQIAVTGFDDIPQSEFLNPSITTVKQPLRDMGAMAFEIIMEKIRHGGGSVKRKVSPVLMERQSA